MKILVTGVAGFIGMHVAMRILKDGGEVYGLDNLNGYYDINLKTARLGELGNYEGFHFEKIDISDSTSLKEYFKKINPDLVIHLAAQAGVRHSISNPEIYIKSNILGFGNILEACREVSVKHLVYASSSSIYGNNESLPFKESDPVERPVSLYGASKKANELMAYTYSHLHSIPTTGLRFFTAYGPWGRPDMSPWIFTSAIIENKEINVFNNGQMIRDFTYIDDLVECVMRIKDHAPNQFTNCSIPPYQILNIGSNNPINLMDYIGAIENSLGIKAVKNMLSAQQGDVISTWADTTKLINLIGYSPLTKISDGVSKWTEWYINYHKNGKKCKEL